jgi:diguanylate cyclase (GGDEF)-like protein/PAS domain S-box-containing protein
MTSPAPFRPYAVLDGDGVVITVNEAFLAATGLDAGALVSRSLTDVWALDPGPAQSPELADVLDRVPREASVRVDASVIGGDGRTHGLHLVAGAEPGTFTLGLADPRAAAPGPRPDVNPDDLAAAVAVHRLDGAVAYLNPAMYRMFGRTPEDMPDRVNLLVHRDDRAAGVELGMRAVAGEIDGWRRQKRLILPDGQLRWVDEIVTLVRDGRGEPLHFLVEKVDIGAAKAAEAAHAEARDEVSFLTDGLPVALLEVDADGRITRSNTAARELLGRDLADQTLAVVTHPEDLLRLRRAFVQPPEEGPDCQLEFRVCRADGGVRWVRAQARLHLDRRGNVVKVVSTWTDITEEVEARESSDRLGELLEAVEDLVAITEPDGRLTYVNGAARAQLGEDAELGSMHLTDLFAPDSAREITDVALSTVRNFGSWTGEVRMVPPGLDMRVMSLSLVAHADARSGQPSLSAMARDITELKSAEEAMRRQATTDALTGLPNRAILFDRLGHALARNARNGSGLALLFVDLDHFKAVNDQMGHDAGDELLVHVAERLGQSVRDCDTVARIGGDEFVVLAEPVVRVEDALVVADRIVEAIRRPVELAAGTAFIGASVGVAMSDRSTASRELLKRADLAVYEAKASGRSCVSVFGAVPTH